MQKITPVSELIHPTGNQFAINIYMLVTNNLFLNTQQDCSFIILYF